MGASDSKPTVLIVDDSPSQRELVGLVVEGIPGFRAKFADSGESATAFGSESLAVQALRSGGAYYVPKDHLEDDLPQALDCVVCSVDSITRQVALLDFVEHSETIAFDRVR